MVRVLHVTPNPYMIFYKVILLAISGNKIRIGQIYKES